MQVAQEQGWSKSYSLALMKGFLIWCFTLTVCLLVVGFPLVFLMMTIGVLMSVVLQSVLPVSSVLFVAGSIIGGNVLLILVGAGVLTFKGIHPQEVEWLHWLHGESKSTHTPIYAACPLTCSLVQ
jgi:energy-coupling factor transporter transmembrane protein EcfT